MIPLRILTAAFATAGLAASLAASLPSSGVRLPDFLPPQAKEAEICALGDAEGTMQTGPFREAVRCSCFKDPEPEAETASYLSQADLVVEVLVVGVDTLGGPLPDVPPPSGLDVERNHPILERLQVERVWKGEVEATLARYRGDAWASIRTSCDITLEEGERYLLFARKNEEKGWITTGYCTGTTTLEGAESSGLRARVAAQVRGAV